MSFSRLGLSAPLLNALSEQQYEKPYPIQEQAIPALLERKDLVAISRTGSGKTAAYALPVLELLRKRTPVDRHALALVLVPTRELAIQVKEVFTAFSTHLPAAVKTMAVFGGVSINPQMMALHGTSILVATPGRLLDLIDSKAVHLSQVEILVLDEADKMLHLGFKEEMDKILALLPEKRQNILCSATFNRELEGIKQNLLHEPVTVEIKEEVENIDQIEQLAYLVTQERKGPFLRYLLKNEPWEQVLVFTSAIRAADNLVEKLKKNGIVAASLHGNLSQGARTRVLQEFKEGKLRVLVASDLASRGIDIQALPVVINYELPRSPKDYVHRIGRTGRAAESGTAISLICPDDQHHFKIIQKKMGKTVAIKETDAVNLHGY